MMRNTNNRTRSIRWKFIFEMKVDLVLISSEHSDIQEKTIRLNDAARYTGLNINANKTKSMGMNEKEQCYQPKQQRSRGD